MIRSTLLRGAEKEPESTTFVLRGKPTSKDAGRWAVEALEAAGRELVLAETNRAYWGTHAGQWRDNEILLLCDMVIVFHDKKSATTAKFTESGKQNLYVIERGAPKKKYQRRGRKPIGA